MDIPAEDMIILAVRYIITNHAETIVRDMHSTTIIILITVRRDSTAVQLSIEHLQQNVRESIRKVEIRNRLRPFALRKIELLLKEVILVAQEQQQRGRLFRTKQQQEVAKLMRPTEPNLLSRILISKATETLQEVKVRKSNQTAVLTQEVMQKQPLLPLLPAQIAIRIQQGVAPVQIAVQPLEVVPVQTTIRTPEVVPIQIAV